MIYITGDCHKNFSRFSKRNFPEQNDMSKKDYVIICGDFGCIWDKDKESKEEKYLMDWLEDKPFTTLFIDGNHENFDRLYAYPEEKWNGGKIHRIRPSVIHLMRGQVFEIERKIIFSFGGAASHDIDGGILEPNEPQFKRKKKLLDKQYQQYRINHINWWKEELPSEEEMEEGRRNLKMNQDKVDFIISHCCSSSTQELIGYGNYKTNILTDYLEEIRQNVTFRKWFFGHYHDNRNITPDEILLYDKIIRIA